VTRPAVVAFHVKIPAGSLPFLASLADGKWAVVPSTYKAGLLSARLPGDPILVPLGWLSAPLEAMVSGALQSVFGLVSTARDPACALNGLGAPEQVVDDEGCGGGAGFGEPEERPEGVSGGEARDVEACERGLKRRIENGCAVGSTHLGNDVV
jgi:hypothetical protein